MDELGEVIGGRYKILKPLGEGAFGVTYIAQDQQVPRHVVVKIAHATQDEVEPSRLRREAQVLAGIHSPHVAGLIDVGSLADGRPFLVVEYIHGRTLEAILLPREGLSLLAALDVLEAMAKGLAAAHAQGVIHRDIKPSNIIVPLGQDGLRYDRAKLVDFGVQGHLEEDTGLTRTGQIFGTPLYMSPEQLRGESQSPATDVYALGAVFFEMIFGHRPFRGETPMRTFLMSLTEEVSIPLKPVIPDKVRSFIQRCLSKDPKKRPDSGASALKEIKELKLLGLGLLSDAYPYGERKDYNGATVDPPSWGASENTLTQLTASDQAIQIEPGTKSHFLKKASVRRGVIYAAISLAVLGLATVMWTNPRQFTGVAAGLLLAFGGAAIGVALPKWFAKRRTQIEIDASDILQGTRSRVSLSQSIAIEVDQLILRVRRLDDRILAKTLAVMLEEYQAAVDSQNRQAALMNVAQLLEKLMARLSPWYIRHEKLIALAVSFIGVLSGAATILASVVKMLQRQ